MIFTLRWFILNCLFFINYIDTWKCAIQKLFNIIFWHMYMTLNQLYLSRPWHALGGPNVYEPVYSVLLITCTYKSLTYTHTCIYRQTHRTRTYKWCTQVHIAKYNLIHYTMVSIFISLGGATLIQGPQNHSTLLHM